MSQALAPNGVLDVANQNDINIPVNIIDDFDDDFDNDDVICRTA